MLILSSLCSIVAWSFFASRKHLCRLTLLLPEPLYHSLTIPGAHACLSPFRLGFPRFPSFTPSIASLLPLPQSPVMMSLRLFIRASLIAISLIATLIRLIATFALAPLGRTGISSDQYFGRGTYDSTTTAEAQNRLQSFQGATAISSNAYFGRPEEDDHDEDGGHAGGGDGILGLGDNETMQGLERGIRDMAGRVLGSEEVQNLGDQIRAGALKVSRGAELCDHSSIRIPVEA